MSYMFIRHFFKFLKIIAWPSPEWYNNLNNKGYHINANFIKEKLPEWVKTVFNNNLYALDSLTIQDKNNNKTITNAQLSHPDTIKNIDINYNYDKETGGYAGNRTFLTVIVE